MVRGVKAGEVVVSEGSDRLADGIPVQPAGPPAETPGQGAPGIRVYSPKGELLKTLALEIHPQAICVGKDDSIFVAGEGRVLKLDPTGGSLVYGTFLGGNDSDYATDIDIDATGNAFITGITFSFNYPRTLGVFDRVYNLAIEQGLHGWVLNASDGVHTVVVTVRNNSGVTRTQTWSFDVRSAPRLSDARPSGSAWVTTQAPAISVAVAENSAVGSTVATLDGAVVSATYDASSGRVNVSVPAALANDLDHDVSLGVADVAGNRSTISWRFHVQTYPKMPTTGAPTCQSCHTGFPASHPMANCDACHGSGGPVEDCRPCHGYGGHDSSVFDSTWWAGPYPCERCHQQAYASKAPVHPADDTYHQTSRDMTECRPCHVAPLPVEHYRYKDSAGATFSCATCHSSADARVRTAISTGNTNTQKSASGSR